MPSSEFTEVAVLTDPVEKLVQAVITARETPEGVKYSFSLLREFIRDGQTARTPWYSPRYIAGIRRALDLVESWFEKEALERKKRR